ncbi:MAG: 4Fe-4S dicluster domain-containing protein [Gemmatimonadota bacterium]|nr:MAG: 4Fe-4S dicluster domain-containing protein [Gemmatimonadota bacterium]
MRPDDALSIAREDLPEWLALLGTRAQMIAPTSGPHGDVFYSPVSSPDEILWEFENSLQPPKRFLLPQTDPLVKIHSDGGRFHLEPVCDDRRQILVNLRSCDLKGLLYLERVHTYDLPDPSYLRRSENRSLVSLACTEPCPPGFCICCDAGPFLRHGFDLQMTMLSDRMFVEVGSDKGRSLLEGAESMFRPATPDEIAKREALEAAARDHFKTETCHFGSAMRRISTGRVAEELWEAMGDWCLECGGCTLICPTCYCFSVKDRRVDEGWVRCRTWDSCQYAAFTLEASGHNPRPGRKDRMKRRFFHKVSAQYYQRDGDVGCVGCGRCIKVCMGTTNMPAVVEAIRKGEWHG